MVILSDFINYFAPLSHGEQTPVTQDQVWSGLRGHRRLARAARKRILERQISKDAQVEQYESLTRNTAPAQPPPFAGAQKVRDPSLWPHPLLNADAPLFAQGTSLFAPCSPLPVCVRTGSVPTQGDGHRPIYAPPLHSPRRRLQGCGKVCAPSTLDCLATGGDDDRDHADDNAATTTAMRRQQPPCDST
jgi:hypothetical protein